MTKPSNGPYSTNQKALPKAKTAQPSPFDTVEVNIFCIVTHGLVVVFVVEFFTPVFGLIGGRLGFDYSYKVDYKYDINGNILNKSDVGDYSYNAASGVRPHTPNSITGIKTNTCFLFVLFGNGFYQDRR
jgi:hypothetical protein